MTDVRAVTVFRFFGGNQLVFAQTQLIPKVERRMDIIVAMVTSSFPIPDKASLPTIQIRGDSFSLMQEDFYTALHQKNACRQYVLHSNPAKRRLAFRP